MKQEYWLALIIGLVVFAYVLDSIVNPLPMDLPTPYHFLTPDSLSLYPFTTTSIVLKATAIFITPLLLFSFFSFPKLFKGIILIVISGLLQLYSLQDIATNAQALPVEWDISLSMAGIALLIPAVIFMLWGAFQKADQAISSSSEDFKL